jgi:hypothetical protein
VRRFLRELRDRMKFRASVRDRTCPFWYITSTGEHAAADSYSVFTDMVAVRRGRFGSCGLGPYPEISREAFLSLSDQGYENRKAAT